MARSNRIVEKHKDEPSYLVEFVDGPKDGERLEVRELYDEIEFIRQDGFEDSGKPILTPVYYSVAGRGDMLMRDDAPRVMYYARWVGE